MKREISFVLVQYFLGDRSQLNLLLQFLRQVSVSADQSIQRPDGHSVPDGAERRRFLCCCWGQRPEAADGARPGLQPAQGRAEGKACVQVRTTYSIQSEGVAHSCPWSQSCCLRRRWMESYLPDDVVSGPELVFSLHLAPTQVWASALALRLKSELHDIILMGCRIPTARIPAWPVYLL